jgi:hypothetical protein
MATSPTTPKRGVYSGTEASRFASQGGTDPLHKDRCITLSRLVEHRKLPDSACTVLSSGRLMRSPCCRCVCISTQSTPECLKLFFIKLGMGTSDRLRGVLGRTSVRAEYGYPKGSPNANSYRRNPPLQLSIQCSPQRTPKLPSSEPHGATRQKQVIAKTPAK